MSKKIKPLSEHPPTKTQLAIICFERWKTMDWKQAVAEASLLMNMAIRIDEFKKVGSQYVHESLKEKF